MFICRAIILVVACAGVLFGSVILSPPANAITLAGNVTASTTGSASSAWEGQIGAENFALGQTSTVNQLGAIFWYDDPPTPFLPATSALSSINWYLYSDSDATSGVFGTPSALLASGSASSLSITNLGDVPQAANLYDLWRVRFSIPDTVLGAGDYWVGFQVVRAVGSSQVFWASAASGDGLNAIYNNTTLSWDMPYATLIPDTVFEVNGETNIVPLPAALPLFASGAGLLGIIGWRRKRRFARAAK